MNLIGGAILVLGGDYVPQEYSVPILAILNILLRFVTVQPVSVLGG